MPNQCFASFLLACATTFLAPLTASAITIDTVPIRNAGNPNDPADGYSDKTGVQNYGAVPYEYRMGTYEVTNAQYAVFLNAKEKSAAHLGESALYNANMASNVRGGIVRSGVNGSFTYTAKSGMGDMPVNYVSWYDAVRFANWTSNGQGNGDTETGSYTLVTGVNGNVVNGLGTSRNVGATWVLPTENEWYKAAYYQPAAEGGDVDGYWHYATGTNTLPTMTTTNGVGGITNPGPNVANYNNGADWNGQNGNLTAVGAAGPMSTSFYGTYDQTGNVWEWNESSEDATYRGLRGGSWPNPDPYVSASYRFNVAPPTAETDVIGFRIALVPEPASIVMGLMGVAALAAFAIRKRRARG